MEELIFCNVLKFGIAGSLVFFILLMILSFTGVFRAIRDSEGKFRKELNWESALGFGIFISLFFTLLYFGNQELINTMDQEPGVKLLWVNAFSIFMIVHLFDLIVVDYLIVVKWHPNFLRLPKTPYYTTMKPHLKGFLKGLFFGAEISFIVALL